MDATSFETMRCIPFRAYACACSDGRLGEHECTRYGDFDYDSLSSPLESDCDCGGVIDAGVAPSVLTGRMLPPRLIAPQSASRVTSQRPTMRWVPPGGVARSRVELCDDRPCTRMIASAEVSGTRWRPETALRPGVVFWRVRGLDADGGVAWASATWEYSVGHRDAPVDTSYGYLQDFNGDGYDDVSMNYFVASESRLSIYPGARDMISQDRVQYVPESLIIEPFLGGDLNGDGLADVVIQGSRLTGFFSVLLGVRGALAGADVMRPSSEVSWRISFDVSSRCDVDGDGFSDVVVPINDARRFYSLPSTWMLVYRGGPEGRLDAPARVPSLTDYLNLNLSAGCAGDVNGDGYQDVLVGINGGTGWPAGHVALYLGGPTGLHNDSLIALRRPPDTEYFGTFRVRGAGDVNGDGLSDFFVDSPTAAFLYLGRTNFDGATSDAVLSGGTPIGGAFQEGWFGHHPAGPADYNGDGYSDIAIDSVCAPGDGSTIDCGPGRVYVFMGSASGVAVTPVVTLMAPEDLGSHHFGADVTAGDYNGDGFSDLLVGGRLPVALDYDRAAVLVYPGGERGLSSTPVEVLQPVPGFGINFSDRRRSPPAFGGV